ncbi:hypothetical protein EL84_14130 [Paenibacillus sp. VT-400]|nr:hypothetical protein EL84_14130 [Paenibacillus sp. VT-400]
MDASCERGRYGFEGFFRSLFKPHFLNWKIEWLKCCLKGERFASPESLQSFALVHVKFNPFILKQALYKG